MNLLVQPALAALTLALAGPPQGDVQGLIATSLPGVVALEVSRPEPSRQSLGSAFVFVRPDVLITNYHVVAGASYVSAQFVGDGLKLVDSVECKLIDSNEDLDLAALRLTRPTGARLHVFQARDDSSPVREGLEAIIIGFPDSISRLSARVFLNGVNLDKEPPGVGHHTTHRFSGKTLHGMSGGPLLDLDGRVLGVHFAVLSEKDADISYCIPASYLRRLDLGKPAVDFRDGPRPSRDYGQVNMTRHSGLVNVPDRSPGPDPAGAPGNELWRCRHWGFVPTDNPEALIDEFVPDRARFARMMPSHDAYLDLLKEHRIIHITNSTYGFGLLLTDTFDFEEGFIRVPNANVQTYFLGLRHRGPDRQTMMICATRFPLETHEFDRVETLDKLDRGFVWDVLHLRLVRPEEMPADAGPEFVFIDPVRSDPRPTIDAATGSLCRSLHLRTSDRYGRSHCILSVLSGPTHIVAYGDVPTAALVPNGPWPPDLVQRSFAAGTLSFFK